MTLWVHHYCHIHCALPWHWRSITGGLRIPDHWWIWDFFVIYIENHQISSYIRADSFICNSGHTTMKLSPGRLHSIHSSVTVKIQRGWCIFSFKNGYFKTIVFVWFAFPFPDFALLVYSKGCSAVFSLEIIVVSIQDYHCLLPSCSLSETLGINLPTDSVPTELWAGIYYYYFYLWVCKNKILSVHTHITWKKLSGAGEMGLKLRTFVAFGEDRGSLLSTHIAANSYL